MREVYGRLHSFVLVLPILMGAWGCRVSENAEQQNPVAALITRLLGENETKRREALLEKLSSADADFRREGVLMLGEGEAAKLEATVKLLASLAESDLEPQVRATAIQVLAKIGSRQKLQEVLPKAIGDESKTVRMECVRVLGQQREEAFLVLLLEMLATDPEAAIRTEAARGLGNYRYRGAIQGLIRALAEDDEFGVWYRSKESLEKLTGKNFGYDPQAWRQWFETTEQPFSDKTGE